MATKLSEISAADMRAAMIDSQLRTNDVIDPAVVGAMAAEPREAYVPAALAGVATKPLFHSWTCRRSAYPPVVKARTRFSVALLAW